MSAVTVGQRVPPEMRQRIVEVLAFARATERLVDQLAERFHALEHDYCDLPWVKDGNGDIDWPRYDPDVGIASGLDEVQAVMATIGQRAWHGSPNPEWLARYGLEDALGGERS